MFSHALQLMFKKITSAFLTVLLAHSLKTTLASLVSQRTVLNVVHLINAQLVYLEKTVILTVKLYMIIRMENVSKNVSLTELSHLNQQLDFKPQDANTVILPVKSVFLRKE